MLVCIINLGITILIFVITLNTIEEVVVIITFNTIEKAVATVTCDKKRTALATKNEKIGRNQSRQK